MPALGAQGSAEKAVGPGRFDAAGVEREGSLLPWGR